MSPLPFAPPPKDSSLYQQLESTTLSTLTAAQLDTIKAKTFSQGTDGNEDEYRRLLLLGLAADQLSISGPIPGTGKITETEITYAESGAATAYKTIFVPGPGEVWQFIAAYSNFSGGSSGQSILMADSEPADLTTPPTTYVVLAQESSTGNPTWSPLLYGSDVFYDENVIPVLQVYSQTTGESSKIFMSWIRVR